MKYYIVIKEKDEILPFGTTWMDQEAIMLSEISQIEKDKYCMISVISGILKKKKKNKQTKNRTRPMNTDNKLMVANV